MNARSKGILLLGTIAVLAMAADVRAACTAPSCTKIIDNGPDAGRKVVVVMGDGYTSTQQATYNTQVQTLVTNGMFANDFFTEQHNAFNVYRLNLNSSVTGVSQVTFNENGTPNDSSDDTETSRTTRNTALKYVYSGVWSHCWLEHTWTAGVDKTEEAKNNALAANSLSHADFVIVVLNEAGGGGCNRGPRDIVQTRSVAWQVLAHESGHGIGGLLDEYTRPGAWAGGAFNSRNCSTVLDRNSIFWNRFVAPATALPTTFGAGMDSNRTVGAFAGCKYATTGIFRPVNNCRMNGNTPNFCPVCQTLMRQSLYPSLKHNFANAVTGDFNGDGRDDVLVQNGNDLAIYRARTGPSRLERVWSANNLVPSASGSTFFWTLAAGDRFYVADFNGDGRDDVYVFNTTSWSTRFLGLLRSNGTGLETVIHYGGTIPGYGSIGAADQLFVADFDGDNKDDLYLFTGTSWSTLYMGLIKSAGTSVSAAARHDGSIPGWIMSTGDKYYVGDFDGDNRDDLYVFNGTDWGVRYLGMLRSSGAGLSDIKLYDTTLASGWFMGAGDKHYVADIDGDNRDDLYVFNGADWSSAYMELTRSTGAELSFVKRYDDDASTDWATNIPGWIMTKGDRHWVSDANKDGRKDLFVFNTTNWSTEYLGTLMSSSTALTGSSNGDWVGGWNLGAVDQILPVNYEGGTGKADIFIRNHEWFGLLRRDPWSFVMDRIYFHWIYSPLHDSKPWSDSMP